MLQLAENWKHFPLHFFEDLKERIHFSCLILVPSSTFVAMCALAYWELRDNLGVHLMLDLAWIGEINTVYLDGKLYEYSFLHLFSIVPDIMRKKRPSKPVAQKETPSGGQPVEKTFERIKSTVFTMPFLYIFVAVMSIIVFHSQCVSSAATNPFRPENSFYNRTPSDFFSGNGWAGFQERVLAPFLLDGDQAVSEDRKREIEKDAQVFMHAWPAEKCTDRAYNECYVFGASLLNRAFGLSIPEPELQAQTDKSALFCKFVRRIDDSILAREICDLLGLECAGRGWNLHWVSWKEWERYGFEKRQFSHYKARFANNMLPEEAIEFLAKIQNNDCPDCRFPTLHEMESWFPDFHSFKKRYMEDMRKRGCSIEPLSNESIEIPRFVWISRMGLKRKFPGRVSLLYCIDERRAFKWSSEAPIHVAILLVRSTRAFGRKEQPPTLAR